METKNEMSFTTKWLQRIGYALSGFGGQIPKAMVDTFASIFLITAAGLNAGHIAVMLMVTKVIDAISDYLLGIAIDATKCKFGRNRLWMLISIPVTFVGVVMLFDSPSFGYGMRLAWAYAAYIIVTTGLTMSSVAANAIVPFLSSEPGERGALVSAKLLLSMVGSMAVTGLVSSLVNLTGGADAVSSYTKAAVAVGLVFAVIIAFAVGTLKEKNYELPEKDGKEVKSNPINDIKILATTKNYLIVLFMGFACMLIQIAMTNGAPYYAGYVLENDSLTGSILMPIMGGSMIPMLLMGILSKKFSKKQIVSIGSILGAILCIVILFMGSNAMALMCVSLLEGITFGMTYVTFFAMQPDVVDEVAYKTGRVMAGLQSSLAGFMCNLGSAVAMSMIAGLIGAAGFKPEAATQSDAVIDAIRVGSFVVPAVVMVLVVIVIQFYDFDEHREEIRAALGNNKKDDSKC